jgi:hypothetical protein
MQAQNEMTSFFIKVSFKLVINEKLIRGTKVFAAKNCHLSELANCYQSLP